MLFACIFVPNFVAQAAVRCDPVVASSAVAIVEGVSPQIRVIALNAKARKLGLWIGMTKTEAEAAKNVSIRERSKSLKDSARAALADCASQFSPRCEGIADDTLVLDIAGLSKLLGTPAEIASAIRREAKSLSLYVKVGIAGNIDSAIHAAKFARTVAILPLGKEAELLKDAPLEILEPAPQIQAAFRRWGIRTFGELAGLPTLSLSQRLGQAGLHLQRLARGLSVRVLSPTTTPLSFEEAMSLDDSVEDHQSLAFIFHRLLEQLAVRLKARALAMAELHLKLDLDLAADGAKATEKIFCRTLKLPVPTIDTKLLLKLLQLDLEAHPPNAPVLKVELRAEPAQPRVIQASMFVPKGPEPQRLEVTLARLRKLVGDGRVGSPELVDRHLPIPFQMVAYSPGTQRNTSRKPTYPRTAIRIYRPNPSVRVERRNGAPSSLIIGCLRYHVTKASGPWRRSGEWWSQEHWGRDEWDLVLCGQDQRELLVRVYRNLISGLWYIEGEFD